MLKVNIAALLIFVATIAAFSFQKGNEWSKFTSDEGRFSVLLPGTPSLDKMTTRAGYLRHAFTVEGSRSIHIVVYTDFHDMPPSAKAEESFTAFRAGLLKEQGMKILNTTEISLKGFPGQELKTEAHGNAGLIRLYLVGKRLYQVGVLFPASQVDQNAANKFFSSFELLQSK